MLNKSLLIKALLSHDDKKTVHDKKEITNTNNVLEKVNAYQEKPRSVTNRVVSKNTPRIQTTPIEKAAFPERQYALTLDPLSKFVIAFTFATAVVAALYFVATTGTHLNRANNESEQIKENDSAPKIVMQNAEADKTKQAKADLGIGEVNAAKANQQTQSAVSAPTGAIAETAQAPKERERQRNQNIELSHQAEARLQPAQPIAPRQLSTQQRAQLTATLKIIPGQITFTVPTDDVEAQNFAQMIADALYDAGWTIQGVNVELLANMPVGLTIRSLISTPHTSLLLRSLRSVGFDVSWSMDQSVPAGTIVLLVGSEP